MIVDNEYRNYLLFPAYLNTTNQQINQSTNQLQIVRNIAAVCVVL